MRYQIWYWFNVFLKNLWNRYSRSRSSRSGISALDEFFFFYLRSVYHGAIEPQGNSCLWGYSPVLTPKLQEYQCLWETLRQPKSERYPCLRVFLLPVNPRPMDTFASESAQARPNVKKFLAVLDCTRQNCFAIPLHAMKAKERAVLKETGVTDVTPRK